MRTQLASTLAAAALVVVPGALAQESGRTLFEEGCSSCHGLDGRGIDGVAPTLEDAGAASTDFYLSTGRMPLDDPRREPLRSDPVYDRLEIRALVAHVQSLSERKGPAIPEVHPERGDLALGLKLYTDSCAGCHQIVGRGGVVIGAHAPALTDASPIEIAEAVRVGPYLMPAFGERQLDQQELDSIVRYIEETKHPRDDGGWAIGHLGPIPEGMVAWLLAIAALVGVARLLGERAS